MSMFLLKIKIIIHFLKNSIFLMTPHFIEKMLNFSVISVLKVIFSRTNSDTIRLRFNYTFTA
jgi:hypothetical protein